MTMQLVIIGAGGHAKVVVDTALACGWTIAGLTNADSGRDGERVLGQCILGSDEKITNLPTAEYALAIGVGEVAVRRRLYQRFQSQGYVFPTLIHPRSSVSSFASVGEGAQIMAGAIVQADVSIGINVVVNTSASIDHDCILDDHTFISPGVVLAGEVHIGANAFLGTGAIVLPRVTIAEGAIVGAGAVVTRNIATHETVMGVPARANRQLELKTGSDE
jgi:sugar O-acyltransferase (sialic acid O-acetyltransferase NeuD family)